MLKHTGCTLLFLGRRYRVITRKLTLSLPRTGINLVHVLVTEEVSMGCVLGKILDPNEMALI